MKIILLWEKQIKFYYLFAKKILVANEKLEGIPKK